MLDQFTRKEGEGEEERASGGSSVSRIGDGERERTKMENSFVVTCAPKANDELTTNKLSNGSE